MHTGRRIPGSRTLALAACGLAALTGIGSGAGAGARPSGRVVEGDFHIKAPGHVAAGAVRLLVTNRGPDAHELIVVRLRGTRLPLRRDGLTVDEDALEPRIAGLLEPAETTTRTLDLHLTPGRYVLFCNMAGHYLSGMRATLVVR